MVVLLLPLVALFSARVPAVRAQDERDDDPELLNPDELTGPIHQHRTSDYTCLD